jgi:hypothetical protein
MNASHHAEVRRSLRKTDSRRGVIGALGGGFLAAAQLAHLPGESKAKKTGKRKKKRKNTQKQDSIEVHFDAICPGPTDNAGSALDEGSLFAQTFTALSTGRLGLAEVLISVSGSGSTELTLQMRGVDVSGAPTTKVLAEASRDVSNVESGESTVLFAFTDPPPVTVNHTYALVLSRTGSRSVSWKGHLGDTCVGRVFRSEPSTAPFEPTPRSDLDLIFATVVIS